ncbi:MAG: ABC transporter substrate-binding protein [Gammaproteobacteria bacterium]|nr:ABC transporter substrate-binding protein [Gammaproteobacteria bacterium]
MGSPSILRLLILLLCTATTDLVIASNAANPDQCRRIISQSPYITKTLQWLNLGKCIVGVSRFDELDLPHTGGILDPDVDAIAALDPDIMLTSNWTPEQNWQPVTPGRTVALRLDGFASMQQVEDNLHLIAQAAGNPELTARAKTFALLWRRKAAQVQGNNKRVLLLSACSGTPYSFGRERWLTELFKEAGFVPVETAEKLRHIRKGEEVEHLNELIHLLEPELIFVFERKHNSQCAAIPPSTGIRIINLDGELFLHPAPVLLKGIDELVARKATWSQ